MEITISDELHSVINYSREEAMRTGSYGIAPDHLILGFLRHRENSAVDTLRGLDIDVEDLKQFIDSHIFTNEHIPYSEIDNITFSRGVQNVLSFTILEATKLRNRQAGVEHLLLALCRAGDSYGITYLRDMGVDYGMIYRYMEKNSMIEKGPEETQREEDEPQIRIRAVREETEQEEAQHESALEEFG